MTDQFIPTPEQAAQTREMMQQSIARTYQVLQKLHPAFSDNPEHWTALAALSATGERLSGDLAALPDDAPYPAWEALNGRIMAWHQQAVAA